jgi:non-ribosomal peptide synthase protein (TIGR01720 family)
MKVRLEGLKPAEISFNYLGQVDAGLTEEGLFRRVETLEQHCRGEENVRSHLLEVEGRVQGGRLQVQWNYSRQTHSRATIEALARSFLEGLNEIIRHCLAPGAGGFTPSDFPEAELSQRDLDDLMAEIG